MTDLHKTLGRAPTDAELAGRLGKAVQIEPTKPMLKASGSKRLKPKSDELLSSFAFNFNLRRYTWVSQSTE